MEQQDTTEHLEHGWEKHPKATGLSITGCNHLQEWVSHSQNTQVPEEAETSKQLPRLQVTTHWESLVPTWKPVNRAVRRFHGHSSTALKAEPTEASAPALAGEGNSDLQGETDLSGYTVYWGGEPHDQSPESAKAWLSSLISKSYLMEVWQPKKAPLRI